MIWVFGDSFAGNKSENSWVSLLGATSLATNGSSEYRIFKTYQENKSKIKDTDLIIFVHTSSTRIYLQNDKLLSSRMLDTHRQCDIVINDVFEKKEKEFIKILELIWDEDYFNDIFNLIVDKLMDVPNSIHITFFETTRPNILSLNHVWKQHPGTINHLSDIGNMLVFDNLKIYT